MRRRKRKFWFLIPAIAAFAALVYLVLNFAPDFRFYLSTYAISLPLLFFPLLFVFLYFLSSFIFGNNRRGFLLSLFFVSFLALRFIGLKSLFFLIILIVLFSCVELFYVKRG